MPQLTDANLTHALTIKTQLRKSVGTIVIGPMNFKRRLTNPVAPIRNWKVPAAIKLP